MVLAVSAEPQPEAKPEAKPGLLSYSAPLISAPYVAATSSQAFVRNYNGLAVSAPLVAAASPLAYTAGYPYAYASPYASPYAYSGFASPLRYAAAAPLLL